ncbi:hypothetical protein JKF63_06260 [Porcisia hertigi]|uniref:PSP1 C-terminal domain-containing protein n=1 Tax=Porcisia hertigi TaxID=2761500 RepID=A0A836LH59_9TRYP|nr:hypothetical protein JKF63_06260 [Porcisia hertigi]
MPSKSANTNGCPPSGGSTYSTRQYTGSNPTGRRAAVPRAQVAQKGTTSAKGNHKVAKVYQKSRATDTRSSAGHPQSEENTVLQRESSSSSTHMLNASSPAFVPPKHLQPQQQQDDTHSAASSSTVTSPLIYTGNTGGGSSASSLPAFTSLLSADRPAAMPSSLSGASAANVDPLATGTSFASSAASGSALSTQLSHQLRGAYARATAAAVAAAAASAAPQVEPTDPYVSVAAANTSVVSKGAAAPPLRPHSEPQPCCALRGTSVAAPPNSNAVYAPSVPVLHPLFIDVATGATSMTPFALLKDQLSGNGDDGSDQLSETLECRATTEAAQELPSTFDPTPSVPLSPLTPALDSREGEVQRVRQAPISANQQSSQRRITAVTAAVLADHDARLAERSKRYAEAGQRLCDSASVTATAAVVLGTHRTFSAEPPIHRDTNDATATAKSTARYQHQVYASMMTTASDVEASAHQTPKRQPLRPSTAIAVTGDNSKVRASVAPSTESGASTAKRFHTYLSNPEDHAEGNQTGSVMGLTGSTRRGPPPCGDDENNEGLCSDTVTPTVTPAKVLAAEGSPFVAAAASSGDASTTRVQRSSLTQKDSGAAHTESDLVELRHRTRVVQQQQHGSNADVQRTVTQFVPQMHTNTTTKAQTHSVATPQRSSIYNAALGETGAAAATPVAFKTPEVERVPSSRPSASKNPASRNITTIIRTPGTSGPHHGGTYTITTKTIISEGSRYHDSAADAGAPAKSSRGSAPRGAQRSLASCLESIAPQREENALSSTDTIYEKVETPATHAPLLPSSSALLSAVAAGAMAVPRSQRRSVKQGSASATTSATPNGTVACVATGGVAASHTPAAHSTSYAVVIEGHMQRRVTAISSIKLKEGVCVLFKEDRGIDMGRIVQCSALDGDEAAGTMATMASATSPLGRKDRPAPVLRLATSEEEYRWLYTDVKEAEATLEPCREAVTRLGLPVRVVAAVYQFNKAKLTVYYESATRVDFRSLLPSLFSRFHCRIWMARLETPEVGAGGFEEGVLSLS